MPPGFLYVLPWKSAAGPKYWTVIPSFLNIRKHCPNESTRSLEKYGQRYTLLWLLYVIVWVPLLCFPSDVLLLKDLQIPRKPRLQVKIFCIGGLTQSCVKLACLKKKRRIHRRYRKSFCVYGVLKKSRFLPKSSFPVSNAKRVELHTPANNIFAHSVAHKTPTYSAKRWRT